MWRPQRKDILFVAGLIGIAFEAWSGTERPTLLLLYAAMIGLPLVLRADERRQDSTRSNDAMKNGPSSSAGNGEAT